MRTVSKSFVTQVSIDTQDISIKVKDSNNNALDAANVTITIINFGTSGSGGGASYTKVTDSTGVVTFSIDSSVHTVECNVVCTGYAEASNLFNLSNQGSFFIMTLEKALEQVDFTIKDRKTKLPLVGCKVIISYGIVGTGGEGSNAVNREAITGKGGKCFFSNVPTKVKIIKASVSKDDYKSKSIDISPYDDPCIYLEEEEVVNNTMMVDFYTYDDDGNMLGAVDVELYGEGIKNTGSNNKARFEEVVVNKKYDYTAYKDGYEDTEGSIYLLPSSSSSDISLAKAVQVTLETAKYDIYVNVKDNYGNSIYDSTVKLMDKQGGLISEKRTLNDEGTCTFKDISPQTLVIEATKSIYFKYRKIFKLDTSNMDLNIVLYLPDILLNVEGVFQNPKDANPNLTGDSEFPLNTTMADGIVTYLAEKYTKVDNRALSDKTEDNTTNLEP